MGADWEPVITPDKKDYLVERVQVDGFNEDFFKSDRGVQGIDPVGFHIDGECPSCKHQTTALCAAKYIAPDDRELEEMAPVRAKYSGDDKRHLVSLVTVLRCACITSHPNAPANTFGCGTEWLMRVSYLPQDEKSDPKYFPVLDSEAFKYWSPADNIATAVAGSLSAAQAIAKNWQAFLTGFLAILGVASVIGGRSTIQQLSGGAQIILGVAAAAALLLNAAVLYYANLAQFGYPKVEEVSKPRYLRDSDLQTLKDASISITKLKKSFSFAVASVVAALVATGIFLFWPPSTTKIQYKLTVVLAGTQAKPTSTLTTGCGSIAYGKNAAGNSTVTLSVSDSGNPPKQDTALTRPTGPTKATTPATTDPRVSSNPGPVSVTYDMKNVVSITGC
jgi:hypothetical protein